MRMPLSELRPAILLLALVSACTTSESTQVEQPAPASPSAQQPQQHTADAAAPERRAPPSALDARLEADARGLVQTWEAAQDAGDFAAYERLYGQRFTGVRRSGPRTRNFERAGWLKDRKRMFAKPMQVEFSVQSVAAQGATVTVLGTQSFRTAGYEDRGQKILLLAREAGELRIVREEMLASDLGPAPTIAARMVVDVPDGPVLVVLGRAAEGVNHGARSGVYAAAPAVLSYAVEADQAGPPPEARAFLDGPVQLVGPDGACTTRAKGLRLAHLAYAHFGQVGAWRGENPDLPDVPKPSEAELAEQIRELDPGGFWVVELEARCVKEPLAAVPGPTSPRVYARSELPASQAAELAKRFAKLPFVQALSPQERQQAMADVSFTRFAFENHVLVSGESVSGCSAPVVHALFDMARGEKLGVAGDQGGLEHVVAVADLDGDGQPEVIMVTAIGLSRWGIVDFDGRERVALSLPYFDCPC